MIAGISSPIETAWRIIRHSPGAVGSIITAVARGLNMAIAEGLQVESEQFERHESIRPQPFVIARSEATKQSRPDSVASWIASLRSQ